MLLENFINDKVDIWITENQIILIKIFIGKQIERK